MHVQTPGLKNTIQSLMKGKIKLLIGITVTAIQFNVVAEQHVHSLNTMERQSNQLKIQQQYIKENPKENDQEIRFKKIAENVYFAENHGANSGLVVADDGLLLIETKGMRNYASNRLLAAIRKISDKPIKYVLNTHSHFDHSGGNAFFAELGATIIAQENYRFTPITHHLRFEKKFTLTMGKEEVVAYHTPTHTLDSTIIYLPNSNVLFMGDNFSTKWLLYEGANGKAEYHKTMNLALSLADSKTVVIPGHGELSKREHLIKSKNAKDELRQRIGELNAKGWTSEKISADEKAQIILSDYANKPKDGRAVHIGSIQDMVDANFIQPFTVAKSLLSDYIGLYKLADGSITEITQDNGQLIIREDGQFIAQLKAITNTRFDLVSFPYVQGEQLEFIRDQSGAVSKINVVIPDTDRFVMNFWLKKGPRTRVN